MARRSYDGLEYSFRWGVFASHLASKEVVVTRFLVTMLAAGSACVLLGQKYTISTVAGSAAGLGDGGTAARVVFIRRVAVVADAAGNIYISDQIYGRIRKIDGVTGVISTLTSVTSSPAGIALDSAGAFLYVAD